jgi:hypothetical protein
VSIPASETFIPISHEFPNLNGERYVLFEPFILRIKDRSFSAININDFHQSLEFEFKWSVKLPKFHDCGSSSNSKYRIYPIIEAEFLPTKNYTLFTMNVLKISIKNG